MRSNLSSRVLTAAIGFGVVMALAVPGSALASDHVRFKARGTGVVAPAMVACPAGFTPLSLTGSGRARHLGRYDWVSTECFNFATFVTVGGRFTLTAANGDTLFGTFSGQARPTDDPTVFAYHDPGVITGGTGRFAHAAGSVTTSGLANLATGEYRGTAGGQLAD